MAEIISIFGRFYACCPDCGCIDGWSIVIDGCDDDWRKINGLECSECGLYIAVNKETVKNGDI